MEKWRERERDMTGCQQNGSGVERASTLDVCVCVFLFVRFIIIIIIMLIIILFYLFFFLVATHFRNPSAFHFIKLFTTGELRAHSDDWMCVCINVQTINRLVLVS